MKLQLLFRVATVFAAVYLLGCAGDNGGSDPAEKATRAAAQRLASETVEAGCGQCQFGMEGDGCNLAVRINGQPYFVVGSTIDDHGDAHAADGLCNTIRHARVMGRIVEGKLHAQQLDLIDSPVSP